MTKKKDFNAESGVKQETVPETVADSSEAISGPSGPETGQGGTDFIAWDQLIENLTNTSGQKAVSKDTTAEIMDSALALIDPIDIAEAAGLDISEKPKQSHKAVCVVNELIDRLLEVGADVAFMMGAFHIFVGSHWQKIGIPMMRSFLFEASIRIGIRVSDAKYYRFVDDLEKQIASVSSKEPPELDENGFKVNFRSGTLDISNGVLTLREHDKKDYLTYILGCDYDPQAKCEMFQGYLDRVLPDRASQENIAEFFGSIFTGLKHEKGLVLLGDGHNGKSVMFDIISGVLGPLNVTHQSLENLNSEYSRASLSGYLLNYASEIGKNPKAEILKKMVSGEPIDARMPYEKPFIMRRYARLAFNANELPKDIEHTDAFYRRLLIIPFSERIGQRERDPNLAKLILASEASGVFNWLMLGMLRLMSNGGFTPNGKADAAIAEYRLESDSVALFIDEMGFKPTESKQSVKQLSMLHEDYRYFCKASIYRPVSTRTMAKRLRALGFHTTHRKTGTYVLLVKDHYEEEKVCF